MDFNVKKLGMIVNRDGPSLGLVREDGGQEVGVLWFQPQDMELVAAFFPQLTGARREPG